MAASAQSGDGITWGKVLGGVAKVVGAIAVIVAVSAGVGYGFDWMVTDATAVADTTGNWLTRSTTQLAGAVGASLSGLPAMVGDAFESVANLFSGTEAAQAANTTEPIWREASEYTETEKAVGATAIGGAATAYAVHQGTKGATKDAARKACGKHTAALLAERERAQKLAQLYGPQGTRS